MDLSKRVLPPTDIPDRVNRFLESSADAVDSELDDDRRWFVRHRKRSYRVRWAFSLEAEQFRQMMRIAEDSIMVAVHQSSPGVRARAPFVPEWFGPTEQGEVDPRKLNERKARQIFDSINGKSFSTG